MLSFPELKEIQVIFDHTNILLRAVHSFDKVIHIRTHQ